MKISRETLIKLIKEILNIDLPQNTIFYNYRLIKDNGEMPAFGEDIDISLFCDSNIATESCKQIFTLNLTNIKLFNTEDKGYNFAWIEAIQNGYSAQEREQACWDLVSVSSDISNENIKDYLEMRKVNEEFETRWRDREEQRDEIDKFVGHLKNPQTPTDPQPPTDKQIPNRKKRR